MQDKHFMSRIPLREGETKKIIFHVQSFLSKLTVFSNVCARPTLDIFNVFFYVFVVGAKDGAEWASCPPAASRAINQDCCEVCVMVQFPVQGVFQLLFSDAGEAGGGPDECRAEQKQTVSNSQTTLVSFRETSK